MKNPLLIAAVMCAASVCCAGASAQGLLDQQLGDKPAQAADTAKKPDQAPATSSAGKASDSPKPDAAKPAGADNDIVNPDAVKRVDDQELINQLIKPGADKPSPQQAAQQLKSMLDRMDQSQQRLTQKDPGDITQETQRRIVMDLDVMIELARQQQQQQGSGPSQPQDGQQRQQQGQQSPGKGEGGTQANRSENLPRGAVTDAVTGDMRNHDQGSWGALPPRDRDQVSHGANEEYLSTYRDLIDRYYQALAELGKSHNH